MITLVITNLLSPLPLQVGYNRGGLGGVATPQLLDMKYLGIRKPTVLRVLPGHNLLFCRVWGYR